LAAEVAAGDGFDADLFHGDDAVVLAEFVGHVLPLEVAEGVALLNSLILSAS
jgi:hypothetical protein